MMRAPYREDEERRPTYSIPGSVHRCDVYRPLLNQDKAFYATRPMRPYPLAANGRSSEGRIGRR